MGSNHGIMVLTMDSWLLTMISWIGFSEKAGFWGCELSPKLKNCYCCRELKSELSYSSSASYYSKFYDFGHEIDHEFMDSNHGIRVISMNLWILTIISWVDLKDLWYFGTEDYPKHY